MASDFFEVVLTAIDLIDPEFLRDYGLIMKADQLNRCFEERDGIMLTEQLSEGGELKYDLKHNQLRGYDGWTAEEVSEFNMRWDRLMPFMGGLFEAVENRPRRTTKKAAAVDYLLEHRGDFEQAREALFAEGNVPRPGVAPDPKKATPNGYVRDYMVAVGENGEECTISNREFSNWLDERYKNAPLLTFSKEEGARIIERKGGRSQED